MSHKVVIDGVEYAPVEQVSCRDLLAELAALRTQAHKAAWAHIRSDGLLTDPADLEKRDRGLSRVSGIEAARTVVEVWVKARKEKP